MVSSVMFVLFLAIVSLGVLVFAGVMGSMLLAMRYVLRSWNRFQSHPVTRGAAMAWTVVGNRTWSRAAGPPPTAAEVVLWSPQRARRHLWASVNAATEAVAMAQETGAGVGELPRLCDRLQTVAASIDSILRMERPGAAPQRQQLHDVLATAADIHDAAVASASAAGAPGANALIEDASREVQSLDAGTLALRRHLPPS